MDTKKGGSFDVEKELAAAVNAGGGFNIYEILNSELAAKKNKINYGAKINISFLESFFNPELGLGLKLKREESKIKKGFYFIGRKNVAKQYTNPILFQDKSLLGVKELEVRDFYFGGNVYGGFFNTGFYLKKILVIDNEMSNAVNSFIDAGSCAFTKNLEKKEVASTVLDFSEKICNLKTIFDYKTPMGLLMEKLSEKKLEKTIFNCSQKMQKKILANFSEILKKKKQPVKALEFVALKRGESFNLEEITDIFLEYKERSYSLSKTFNTFFIVEGKANKIFLLDFFKKDFKVAKALKILAGYSELAAVNESFIKAFATEIFLDEK
jgi:hypothetical protein